MYLRGIPERSRFLHTLDTKRGLAKLNSRRQGEHVFQSYVRQKCLHHKIMLMQLLFVTHTQQDDMVQCLTSPRLRVDYPFSLLFQC